MHAVCRPCPFTSGLLVACTDCLVFSAVGRLALAVLGFLSITALTFVTASASSQCKTVIAVFYSAPTRVHAQDRARALSLIDDHFTTLGKDLAVIG